MIIFLPLKTGMNTLPNIYKLFYFNLTMSPLYLVKLKITQKQPTAYAVPSVEPIVPDFRTKYIRCSFLSIFVRKFLWHLVTENLLQKIIFKFNMGNFNM